MNHGPLDWIGLECGRVTHQLVALLGVPTDL